MKHLDLVQALDNKLNDERLEIIIQQLEQLGIAYSKQQYASGTNLIVDLGHARKRIGVSSHFDRVQESAGANDNGSAIAVCLDIIRKFKKSGNDNLGLRIFFFDEEETGLKGSTAYTKERGINDLVGLINMELVGLGDKFALWPVDEKASGKILNTFESVSKQKQIVTRRIDRIVTNTADHLSFREAGLQDAFTITCISDKDLEIAQHYFRALALEVDRQTLVEILSKAPVFEHYHKPTDTFNRLSEDSISMTSATVWETIIAIQK
ncbi:M28 family peptidase [Fulvivirgaceae bacterium PWU4]|uniref:M28 family peptidase n=1 Tax=Chryseosolibacter histidini TaxID=2782349 RepID=A0AAP2DNF0_9BACT|nr:M28 family peptidase [Chryseosolibacter histidini]MBT1699506.1 M28 family peptidase [Chryseosolibacter histidini]